MLRRTVLAFLILILICVAGFAFSAQTPIAAQQAQTLSGKNIYLSTSNGEISLFNREATGASRLAAMLVREGANLLILNWDVPIPSNADVVVLIGPSTDYSGSQMAKLWTYVNEGGNLLVFVEPGRGLSPESPLIDLLWSTFGIRMNEGILINTMFLDPAVIQRPNDFVTNLVPATQQQHPILEGIEMGRLVFFNACGLQTESLILDEVRVEPLLVTADQYYAESNLRAVQNNDVEFNIGSDLAGGSQVVAAAATNSLTNSHIAIVCDADVLVNQNGFVTSPSGSDRFVFSEDVKLVFNTIYWTLNVTDKPVLQFEAPAATSTPTITPSPAPTSTSTPEGFSG